MTRQASGGLPFAADLNRMAEIAIVFGARPVNAESFAR
jgi:hypothetical protein